MEYAEHDPNFIEYESRRLREKIAHLRKDILLEKPAKSPQKPNLSYRHKNLDDTDDEKLRYFQNEAHKLNLELNEAQKYIEHLLAENRKLTIEIRKNAEDVAEVSLLRKQMENLRSTLDKLPADDLTWKLRVDVLEETLREVQRENFDLRRQLIGVTPEKKVQFSDHASFSCKNCTVLKKQRVRQAQYLQAQLFEKGRLADAFRDECQILKQRVAALEAEMRTLENGYRKQLVGVKEDRDLCKRHNERLSKWHKTQMQGFTVDVDRLKSQLLELEKYFVKAQQLASNAENQRQMDLVADLKKLTLEAAAVANEVKRWRNIYDDL